MNNLESAKILDMLNKELGMGEEAIDKYQAMEMGAKALRIVDKLMQEPSAYRITGGWKKFPENVPSVNQEVLVTFKQVQTQDVVCYLGKDKHEGYHKFILGNIELDPKAISYFRELDFPNDTAMLEQLIKAV